MSVSMGGGVPSARSAEGAASVSMGGGVSSAQSAEGQAFASMGKGRGHRGCRWCGWPVSASMGGAASSARSGGGPAFDSTGSNAVGARGVEGQAPVSMHGRWRNGCKGVRGQYLPA